MKTTMLKRLLFLLLITVSLLSFLSFAAAETGTLQRDQVELLSEGKFPPQGLSRSPRADLSGFNDRILTGLKARAESIDVSDYKLTTDEFRTAYQGLLNSRPEMFYVSGGYSYYYDDGIITEVIPNYKYSEAETAVKLELFNRKLGEIVSYANKASTTVGKLLLASDYICVNYEYDEPARDIHSPEEMFETGRGVCQAYTLVYIAVCNELGVTSTTATSDAMNHIWNVVKLDGSWYHVDVTWNDPIMDMPYRAKHDNFLRSDAGIEEAGHYSWVSSVTATSTKYDNYFWQDIDHAVPVLGDLAYFTPNNNAFPDGRICTGNITTGEVKQVLSYNANFYGSCYPNINPVWATSSTVYYGLQDTVYALPRTGGTPVKVFSLNDKQEYLFYFYLSGNTMYLTSKNMGTNADSVHSFKLASSVDVTLSPAKCYLKVGESKLLSYTIDPAEEAASAEWKSSNKSVATVDSNGRVTAVAPGTATISLVVGSASAESTIMVHSYDSGKITTPATCTASGVKTFTCTTCGDTYTETIPATGHTETEIPAVAPTCTESGWSKGSKCSVCGHIFTAPTEIPATNHVEGSTIVIKAPTLTAPGTAAVICSVCGGQVRTQSIPACLPGDANMDGKVSLADAMCILRYRSGKNVSINLHNADVNGDGLVTAADALLLMQYEANWNVTLVHLCGDDTDLDTLGKFELPMTGDTSTPLLWLGLCTFSALALLLLKRKQKAAW